MKKLSNQILNFDLQDMLARLTEASIRSTNPCKTLRSNVRSTCRITCATELAIHLAFAVLASSFTKCKKKCSFEHYAKPTLKNIINGYAHMHTMKRGYKSNNKNHSK